MWKQILIEDIWFYEKWPKFQGIQGIMDSFDFASIMEAQQNVSADALALLQLYL